MSAIRDKACYGSSQRLIALDRVVPSEYFAAFLMVQDPVPAADWESIQIRQARLKGQVGVFPEPQVMSGHDR